jgi:hypothetical protein
MVRSNFTPGPQDSPVSLIAESGEHIAEVHGMTQSFLDLFDEAGIGRSAHHK